MFFEDLLKKEINEDREAHGKRPLKEKDDDSNPPSGPSGGKEEKTIKTSTSDPESGWFHKGEHKSVFAYAVQTACDKNCLLYTSHTSGSLNVLIMDYFSSILKIDTMWSLPDPRQVMD